MARTADHTIKGFLYQFNKTILEILQCTDDTHVMVEGIIEDIDLAAPEGITAIQCKYHEAQEKFTLGLVYKPILQMMNHFHKNPAGSVKYILFAHFPGKTANETHPITKGDIDSVLKSKDKDLKKYITPIKDTIDIDGFLSCFTMQFGQSYDSLVASVYEAMTVNGMPAGEIETLSYPNAIHNIAVMSTRHEDKQRKITKAQFLDNLRQIRKTAISRWTLSLKSHNKILEAIRKQLKSNLDKNARLRYFVVSGKVENFSTDIVLFITDIVDKYHFKPAHIRTPLFCLDCTEEEFDSIRLRLYQKGILAADGFIGDHFDKEHFFREPMVKRLPTKEMKREFKVRLLWFPHHEVINDRKCDDLFLIGCSECTTIDIKDVNVEHLDISNLKEMRYLLGVSNVHE